MLLLGVWAGYGGKPNWHTFLSPILARVGSLVIHGHSVKFDFCVSDLPAKASVLNATQFNGEYGCSICLEPGEHRQDIHRRIYPNTVLAQIRTEDEVRSCAACAEQEGTPVLGIRGPSVLAGHMPLVWGNPIDYMHSVCEGVVKRMTSALLVSGKGGPILSSVTRKLIDADLQHLKVPHEFQRTPRPASDLKRWKAQEFRNFLFYYSPLIFAHRVSNEIAAHFLCLSLAIYLMTAENCSVIHVDCAEMLLIAWHSCLSAFYGEEACSYNAHAVLHLSEQVRQLGPLWTHSSFVYESLNHELKQLCTGSTFTAKQVATRFVRSRLVTSNKVAFVGRDARKKAGVSVKMLHASANPGVFGVNIFTPDPETVLRYTVDPAFLAPGSFMCDRVIHNDLCYISQAYTKRGKTATCCAMTGRESACFLQIAFFLANSDGLLYAAGEYRFLILYC